MPRGVITRRDQGRWANGELREHRLDASRQPVRTLRYAAASAVAASRSTSSTITADDQRRFGYAFFAASKALRAAREGFGTSRVVRCVSGAFSSYSNVTDAR